MNASGKAAIARIGDDAWTPIRYPQAVWDEEGQCWISDAEIAGTSYTAFTSKPKTQQVTARLIVRRVKRLNTDALPAGQGDTLRHLALPRRVHRLPAPTEGRRSRPPAARCR